MERILTGLKPTGDLTLGNYIGSIKQMVDLQEKYDSFIFVADLHALTVEQDPYELNERIRKFIAMYIACGLDPKKNTIYIQSENEFIPAMSYLLECTTYYGEASRMIQFKEKSKQNANFSVGLLTYPVLMAADIIYCDADYVPVGIDQKQHVELARNIAERFNNKYGETFKVPEPYISKSGAKIMSLTEPTKKMSKSDPNPKSYIALLDDINVAKKKIKSAITDLDMKVKYDEVNKPGISNLLTILSCLTNTSIADLEEKYKDSNYATFKEDVANAVEAELRPIQEKYNEIINSKYLDEVLDEGRDYANYLANKKIIKVYNKVGLGRKR
jgi:tryptophanyl-tRNA synthetase